MGQLRFAMRKGSGKDALVVIDSYTKKEIARFDSIVEAVETLGVRQNTIYVSIHNRKPAYECYWVYAKDLPKWQPAPLCHRKTKGTVVPDALKKLIDEAYNKI